MRRLNLFIGIVVILVPGSTGAMADNPNPFGNSTKSEAALIGIFYDLKQTPEHKDSGVGRDEYCTVTQEFINKNWDETLLNRYYRVSHPLYTTQVFIPNMSADEAPRAFGAEKTVAPSRWVIHYKGQVSPPEAGTYRFLAAADDFIAVAVNGKTVLVSSRFEDHPPGYQWKTSEPDGAQAADDKLRHGDWMTLKANQIIDLDVMIGEWPGGAFNAFLLIEKQGENYAHDDEGNSILPIFQVAPYDTPVITPEQRTPNASGNHTYGDEPIFAKGYPTWKSYQ